MENEEKIHIIKNSMEHDVRFRKRISQSPDYELIREYIKDVTDFLPVNSSWMQRLWHIDNSTYENVICKHCRVNVVNFNKKDYGMFCSIKCLTSSDYKRDKMVETSLSKHGVTHHAKTDSYKDKMRGIANDRYGVPSYFMTDTFKEKSNATILEKYGVEHHTQLPEIIDKRVITVREKYGVDSVLQCDEVKLKISRTMMERYGVEHVSYKKLSDGALETLNDIEWLTQKNHVDSLTLSEIAVEIGVNPSTVSDYFYKHNIPIKYHAKSLAENELSDHLTNLGVSIVRNSRSIIPPKELDILIPDYNIAIEYNGIYWHTDRIFSDRNYHKNKVDECRKQGIRLLTIYDDEWNSNKELVINKILSILGKSTSKKVYARKTVIKEIDTETKRNFFNTNHIQGDGPSSINYGLYDGDELVACIGFIKQSGHYVLNRYATAHNVVGGFTKLLKHFEKQFDMPEIITFADLRWSEGDLYKNTGFELDKILKPDYKWAKGNKVYHKFNFRHKGMSVKLENYDPALSENDNMTNHGFHKLWDCGKLRFVKNKKINYDDI